MGDKSRRERERERKKKRRGGRERVESSGWAIGARVGPSTLHVNWRTGVGAGSRRLITGATETDRLHTHTHTHT